MNTLLGRLTLHTDWFVWCPGTISLASPPTRWPALTRFLYVFWYACVFTSSKAAGGSMHLLALWATIKHKRKSKLSFALILILLIFGIKNVMSNVLTWLSTSSPLGVYVRWWDWPTQTLRFRGTWMALMTSRLNFHVFPFDFLTWSDYVLIDQHESDFAVKCFRAKHLCKLPIDTNTRASLRAQP